MITEENRPKKFGLTRTGNLLEFKKLCKAEGIQIYSTMSETKAAFAERAIRSLKHTVTRKTMDICTFTN